MTAKEAIEKHKAMYNAFFDRHPEITLENIKEHEKVISDEYGQSGIYFAAKYLAKRAGNNLSKGDGK